MASETLAQALSGLRRFKPAKGNAAQWLYGIARHLLMRYWRSLRVDDRSRRRLGIDAIIVDDETTALVDRIAAEAALRHVQAILDALPPGQREACGCGLSMS